jgi:hypothetical protein
MNDDTSGDSGSLFTAVLIAITGGVGFLLIPAVFILAVAACFYWYSHDPKEPPRKLAERRPK